MKILSKIKIDRQTLLVLFSIYFLTIIIRFLATSGANFPFWFDSGRDAIVSRTIIEQADFKIQGPTASGTNDTVYHGVIYYYIIGPLYSILGGDPRLVIKALILLTSLSVLPIYFLTKELWNKEAGVVATLFYAFSYDSLRSATWFSNPVIASLTLPLFFYLFWLVFFKSKIKLFPVLTLTLALTHQSSLLHVPWIGLIGFGFFYYHQANRSFKKWKRKYLINGAAAYFIGISTMILAQLKSWRSGIFDPLSLSEFASWGGFDVSRIIDGTYWLFVNKVVQSIFPTIPLLSVIIFIASILYVNKKLKKERKIFLIMMFTAPLWLLSWHYRHMYHTLLSVDIVIYIVLAIFVTELWKAKTWKIIVLLIAVLFIKNNYSMYQLDSSKAESLYFVQKGAYLRELLQAVDYTYQQAEGKPFSISTITNPYGFNSLWAYLYSWYGQDKYGYKPFWYGPDQTGIFGGELLDRATTPSSTHFSIKEPNNGTPGHLYLFFEQDQEAEVGPLIDSAKFGAVNVDTRSPK